MLQLLISFTPISTSLLILFTPISTSLLILFTSSLVSVAHTQQVYNLHPNKHSTFTVQYLPVNRGQYSRQYIIGHGNIFSTCMHNALQYLQTQLNPRPIYPGGVQSPVPVHYSTSLYPGGVQSPVPVPTSQG